MLSRRPGFVTPLLIVSFLSACAPDAPPPSTDAAPSPAGPASVGFDPDRLATLSASLEELVEGERVAGLVTMLARHGEVVQSEAFGYQDRERTLPMETDTIFRIFSMTKPVTGVAMMILYEQGSWDLEDPVSRYIPEFEGLEVAEEGEDGSIRRVPQQHPMTMRELMTHTGGLTYGLFSQSTVDAMYLEANVLDPDSSLQAMIDKLSDLPLRQQPGSMWHYSVSVDVQGYIVEKLSGETLPQFFQNHIFVPLGMEDTGFHVPAGKVDRLAPVVYDYGPEGELIPSAALNLNYLEPPGLPMGGGGLVSTASDYMRFSQMLLNGGELDGVRILRPETVDLMRADQAPTTETDARSMVPLAPGTGFGLDVAVMLDPVSASSPLGAGSYWWAGAAGTWFWIDPVNDLVFIGLAQHDFFDIADFVPLTQELVYEALVDPEL